MGKKFSREQQVVLDCPKDIVLVTGGDQSGKSEVAAEWFGEEWLRALKRWGPEERLVGWLVGNDYEQNRREFEYICRDMGRLGFLDGANTSKRIDPGHITLTPPAGYKHATVLMCKSAKDNVTLNQVSPHFILANEAGQMSVDTYRILYGRSRFKPGRMLISGTLEDSLGWYAGLRMRWENGTEEAQAFSMPTWTNLALFPGGREDPKIRRLEAELPPEFFLQRYGGQPCPPKGLVFPEFRAWLHIKPVEYLPGEPVYLAEDPGYGSSIHSIEFCQIVTKETVRRFPEEKPLEGQIRVFDEIFERGFVTEDLISVCVNKPWWREAEKILVSDPHYSEQHHAGPSVNDIWMKVGLKNIARRCRIGEQIERHKTFLKEDPLTNRARLEINPRCQGLISEHGGCLNPLDERAKGQYGSAELSSGRVKAYQWKMARDGTVIGTEPEDANNHAIKAVSYLEIAVFGVVEALPRLVEMRSWRRR